MTAQFVGEREFQMGGNVAGISLFGKVKPKFTINIHHVYQLSFFDAIRNKNTARVILGIQINALFLAIGLSKKKIPGIFYFCDFNSRVVLF
jgi:hypothetical protein